MLCAVSLRKNNRQVLSRYSFATHHGNTRAMPISPSSALFQVYYDLTVVKLRTRTRLGCAHIADRPTSIGTSIVQLAGSDLVYSLMNCELLPILIRRLSVN